MERTIERREQNRIPKKKKTCSVLELEEKGKFSRPIKLIDRNIFEWERDSHGLESVHLMLKEM
jgi:hypothetical protein